MSVHTELPKHAKGTSVSSPDKAKSGPLRTTQDLRRPKAAEYTESTMGLHSSLNE